MLEILEAMQRRLEKLEKLALNGPTMPNRSNNPPTQGQSGPPNFNRQNGRNAAGQGDPPRYQGSRPPYAGQQQPTYERRPPFGGQSGVRFTKGLTIVDVI